MWVVAFLSSVELFERRVKVGKKPVCVYADVVMQLPTVRGFERPCDRLGAAVGVCRERECGVIVLVVDHHYPSLKHRRVELLEWLSVRVYRVDT